MAAERGDGEKFVFHFAGTFFEPAEETYFMEHTEGIYGGRFSGAGFNGSSMALINPAKKDEIKEHVFYPGNIDREDLDLIYVVKKLGNKANGTCSELKIVEIPDGIEWEISEYDGLETVEEKHRNWY